MNSVNKFRRKNFATFTGISNPMAYAGVGQGAAPAIFTPPLFTIFTGGISIY